MSPRREMIGTLALLVLGAALVLLASTQVWVTISNVANSTPTGTSGAEIAPGARALGLVGLAGVVALIAARGLLRRFVVGGLLTLTGLGIAVLSAFASYDDVGWFGQGPAAAPTPTLWWLVSTIGGLCVAAVGLLVLWRAPRWPAMSGRYDAPSNRRTGDDAWSALDRGEDPTT